MAQEAPTRAKIPTTGAQRGRPVLRRACVEKLAAKLEKSPNGWKPTRRT
jgi:hypothetical protein